MPYSISLSESGEIINLIYSGTVSPKELYNALIEAVALAKEYTIKLFFADCSEMVGGHSVFDLYALISLYKSVGVPGGFKEALILPQMQECVKAIV